MHVYLLIEFCVGKLQYKSIRRHCSLNIVKGVLVILRVAEIAASLHPGYEKMERERENEEEMERE